MAGLISKFKNLLSETRAETSKGVIIRSDSPRPDGSNIPASEELYNMALQAIEKHFQSVLSKLENSGEIEGYWRQPIEELMYSGAFSETQLAVLHEKMQEKVHTVSVVHARVLATRILCGVEDTKQPNTKIVYETAHSAGKGLATWK